MKALALFLVANLAFAWWYPFDSLGHISGYNWIFPGRIRLPYGDNPERAYNLSLYNMEAMFTSHEIDGASKEAGEYRVILIGDSATWGFLLPPEQTLGAYLNRSTPALPDGRKVRVYNLGYPVMSLTKDLLLLSYAMRYQPDLVIWPVTLESFPYDKQLFPPLVQNNPEPVRRLIETYHLALNPYDDFHERSLDERTLAGSRRDLADLVRLQLYGVMWAATGIDQDIPITYTLRMEDLTAEPGFHDLQPPHLSEGDLALDVLEAGVALAGNIPVLIVNEPMFISQGENSHIRYNFYYPRWAYDDYRRLLAEKSQASGWHYLDQWNLVGAEEFTNTAVHMTPAGVQQFAASLVKAIREIASQLPSK